MCWLKEIITTAWTWFILAGAVILIEIILKEYFQEIIENCSSTALPYIKLVKYGAFLVPTFIGIILTIKNYEGSK